MSATRQAVIPRLAPAPPGTRRHRLAFLVLWVVDLVAASLFVVLPQLSELNPITVHLYELFGVAGVAFAASCYAAVVVVLGHALSSPWDVRFLKVVVALYALFAINNVPLLLFGFSLIGVIGG